MLVIVLLLGTSLVALYSASIGTSRQNRKTRLRNIAMSFLVMWFGGEHLAAEDDAHCAAGLCGDAVAAACGGAVRHHQLGARRWLNLGFVQIQPSEFAKIAVPLMLAWCFQQRHGHMRWHAYILGAPVLLVVPVFLIARQPDLGTALLVVAAGACVIFLAGLAWRAILALVVMGAACLRLPGL